jgi:hypothetical protein
MRTLCDGRASDSLDAGCDGMPDDWGMQFALIPSDAGGDTNLEKHFNGVDPSLLVDYTKAEKHGNTLLIR